MSDPSPDSKDSISKDSVSKDGVSKDGASKDGASKDGILGASTRLLREKTGSFARMARKASGNVGDMATRTVQQISDRSLETTTAWLQASKDWTVSLLPETRVQAFLLPTGSGTADFICAFDFKDILERLAGGTFTRPCLEIWAAREDVHRPALATHLRQEFTDQLKAEREHFRRAAEETALPQLQNLDKEKNKTGNLVEVATFGFTSSLLLLFTVANPIFDLVFVLLAVFSGAGGLTKALRYIQLTLKMRNDEKSLEAKQKELESELDAKNQEFLSAIENLDIKIHPVLERIWIHMCDLDGNPRSPSYEAQEEGSSPLVDEYLKTSRYRAAVPTLYHPLIDAEMK